MADRYFDRNGSTAGFGTLTGAWNTSSAFWSTSSAGTAVPGTFTFTSADRAFFGAAGATATAGTATIADGITVTLNGITTANLAGLQTIARTTSGALAFAGTTPSLVVGSAGGLTISAPVAFNAATTVDNSLTVTLSGQLTGTGTLTKAGSGDLVLTGTANTYSGALTINTGTVYLLKATTGTPDQINNVSSVTLGASGALLFSGGTGTTFTKNINGSSSLFGGNSALVFGSPADLSGFTGTFYQYSSNTVFDVGSPTNTQTTFQTATAFPVNAGLIGYRQNSDSPTLTIAYTGSGNVSTTGNWNFFNFTGGTGAWTAVLRHYGTSGATFTVGGSGKTVSADGSYNLTWQLDVSSTGALSVNSNVVQPAGSGVLSLQKIGTGPVVLAGANTFTGTVSVSAGTLNANSTTALGAASSTAAISVTSGATLSLGAALNYSSPGRTTTIGGTGVSTGGALIHNHAGTVHVGVINLGSASYIRGTATGSLTSGITATTGALTLGAAASTVFTLPGAMSSNLLLTLANSSSDTGEVILSGFNSSLTGAITVNYGTLSFANQNAVGAIGTITLTRFGSVVQFNAATTSNRPITGRGDIALKATGAYSFGQITIAGGNGSAFGGNTLGLTAYETATLTSTVDFLSSISYSQEFYPKAKAGKTLTLQGTIYSNVNSNPSIYYWAETGGSVVISGTNYYDGYSILYEGTIQAASPEVSGVGGPFGINTTSSAILMYGTGILQYSTLNAADYSGRFNTTSGEKWKIDTNGQSVTFASTLQGAGNLVQKLGTGTLTLTAANTYTGSTTVTTGTLRAGNTQAFGTTGTAILASGATLQTLTAAGQNGKLTVAALTNSAGGIIKIGG